jgi:hypothetical protein
MRHGYDCLPDTSQDTLPTHDDKLSTAAGWRSARVLGGS